MRLPCFGVAFSAMMLFRTGIGAIPFLLPMMLQVGFGNSAVQSGLITFASSAGALVMKPAAQRALRLFGFRDTLIWNGLIVRHHAAAVRVVPPDLAGGGDLCRCCWSAVSCARCSSPPINTLAYGDVSARPMSAATSLYTAGQQLAATIGVSVGALALEVARSLSQHRTPEISDFSAAFVVVGLMTLAAVPIALLMPTNAGDDLTGRHPPEPPSSEPAPALRRWDEAARRSR